MIYFTSSWDDGSVYDIRLSELLLKYNHKATFFIPINNVEKRSVITPEQIRNLSENFEIGAHTINHEYLTRLSIKDALTEIELSKKELEIITNKPVNGFCFPGGKFDLVHLNFVYQVGFKYARTTSMFKLANTSNTLNTTLQAFDHSKFTYFKHLIKRGNFVELFQYSVSIFTNKHWDSLLYQILLTQLEMDSPERTIIIHLWGHSWEIEENDHWARLENLIKLVNQHHIKTKTNFEITHSI